MYARKHAQFREMYWQDLSEFPPCLVVLTGTRVHNTADARIRIQHVGHPLRPRVRLNGRAFLWCVRVASDLNMYIYMHT